MFKTSLVLIVLLIILSTTCYGGEIVLKKSFWWGYLYTKDGVEHKVGDGLRLKRDMVGAKEAQVEIDKYRRRRSLYICFDLLCWTSLVAMHGRDISRGYCEWDDTRVFLYASGLTTLAGGFFLWLSANSHLKKGVGIYNDSLKQQQANTQRLNFMVTPRSGGFSFAMKCSF
jgi:hypothetical protein